MTLKFFSLVSVVTAFAIGQPVQSQTLTPAEIMAQVNAKVAGVNEYQQLLNDPDPNRSLAAMQVMLGSGDVELVRMALDYGLYSPNPVVQRTAIEAFLQSKPVLSIYMEMTDGDKNSNWGYHIERQGGSVLSDGKAFRTHKVGDFNPEKSCFVYYDYTDYCFVRVSDYGASVALWEKWHDLKLNDQGQLVGSGAYPGSDMPVKTVIPLSQ